MALTFTLSSGPSTKVIVERRRHRGGERLDDAGVSADELVDVVVDEDVGALDVDRELTDVVRRRKISAK